ncbi:MAG: serine/threonine protein kinase, partial [Thermoplasmata archaeon]|nr:serine/threonine protein kinase [Thermoplasmata archaeon]
MAYISRLYSPGDVVEDKYRVEKELGRGGMSILYLVTSLESDEKVVLKQPKHDIPARHELYCESIRHEANILSRLDHPQIVKYVDFIHKYNILIMSYVEGKSLSELYDCKKATREDSLDIMRRLCDVVSYLHDQGIVHRDICPNNIILGPNKMPILLDFGTGYDMKQDNSVTKSVFHGSYSPPELARRDGAGDHGASIDVFSL